MRTPHASAALIIFLILTPVALVVGTIYLFPAAVMLFPFAPLLAVVALLALDRPSAGNIGDSQVAAMDQGKYDWFGSDALSEEPARKPVVLGELGGEAHPALHASLNRELANGKVALHDLMP